MATKRVCDRCGAEINPFNSVTYAGMRRIKTGANIELSLAIYTGKKQIDLWTIPNL